MCRMNENEMISTNLHVHYVMFHNKGVNTLLITSKIMFVVLLIFVSLITLPQTQNV